MSKLRLPLVVLLLVLIPSLTVNSTFSGLAATSSEKGAVFEAVTLPPTEGNVTTEGFGVMNGPAWRAAGHTGKGVKIAIVDAGFEGHTGLLGTELPEEVTVRNFTGGEIGSTNHGTACAEIAYDMVPDAEFYLVKASMSDVESMEEAVNYLIDEEVDVISTSIGDYLAGPGDGTGDLADLVGRAREAGILWVTTASSARLRHWGGAYNDPNNDDIHNFNSGRQLNYFADSNGDYYNIPAGKKINIYARWDDWTDVNQDYNLRLLRWNGATWKTVDESNDVQDGRPGQEPTERITFTTSGSPTRYGFAIVRHNANRNVHFEIFAPDIGRLYEYTPERSLVGPADAPDVITVATLDVESLERRSYSSQGPTNGPGGSADGGSLKPDISAYDGVSTVSYSDRPNGFQGGSAATPHVAGAAALIKSAYPSYGPDDIQSFLEDRAIAMSSTGPDTQYGHGRLYLGAPPGGNDNITSIYLPLVTNGTRTPPATGSINLSVDSIELSQAIQDTHNNVPLVANRPAIMRLFVKVENSPSPVNGVTARLHAARNGTELSDSPIAPFNSGGSFSAPLSPSREEFGHSLNFQLPPSWTNAGQLRLWVSVNPQYTVPESNYGDNRSQDVNFTFHDIPPLEVVLIPIAYQPNGTGAVYRPDMNESNNFGLGMLQHIYPIPDITYTIHSEYSFKGDLSTSEGRSQLLSEIRSMRAQELPNSPQTNAEDMPKYYGVIPSEADRFGGGSRPGTASFGHIDIPWVTAHEIGHNFGFRHVDCGNPPGIDPNYPYPNGEIGNVGINVYQRELLSASMPDIMSYCHPVWISDYHYRKIFDVLAGADRQPQEQEPQRGWLISGRIYPDGTASLDNAEPILSSAVVEEASFGLYDIELVDQSDVVQFRYSFNPIEIAQEDETPLVRGGEGARGRRGETTTTTTTATATATATAVYPFIRFSVSPFRPPRPLAPSQKPLPSDFVFVVPQIENLARIQLKQGSKILATLEAATAPPTLQALKSASRGSPDKVTISWDVGTHRGAEQTTVNLRYSADGGQTWQTLAVGLTDNSFDLTLSQLPASENGLIEVIATNSTQSARRRLELGQIGNKAPQVGILFKERIQLYPGEPLILEGAALDLEDGSVTGHDLVWSEATLGQLGTGQTLILAEGLKAGNYTINLTATDSHGDSASDSVSVTVGQGNLDLPIISR